MKTTASIQDFSLANFKKFRKLTKELVTEITNKRLVVQAIKKDVDSYLLPYFQSFEFRYDDELGGGAKITDPEDVWMCSCFDTDKLEIYYEGCDRLHKRHGWNVSKGINPYTIVREELVKMENYLLTIAKDVFGPTLDFTKTYEKSRTEAVDFFMSTHRS